MRRIARLALPTAIILSALLLTGCSRVVVNNHGPLKDGDKWEFPLKPGIYEVQMSATADGAALEWQGCDCAGTGPSKKWAGRCRIDGAGKLIVRNPSVLGLGSETQVNLKVTKVPR